MTKLRYCINRVAILAPFILSSCYTETSMKRTCLSHKHDVFLYVNNLSFKDTLANANLRIDDSLYLDKRIAHSVNPYTPYKMIRLCDGLHQLKIVFGRFEKDTVLNINYNASLFINMNYFGLKEPLILRPDGIQVSTLKRDGSSAVD